MMTYTGHRFAMLELAKEEDLGRAQKPEPKNAFEMKEAFTISYAGLIRRTKLPAQ